MRLAKTGCLNVLITALMLIIGGAQAVAQTTDFARYIDPMIGTLRGAFTFPGPCVPWGMVQLTPYTNGGSVSGFFASDPFIYGFVHTDVSGPGCSGWGNLLLMATTGEPSTEKEENASVYSGTLTRARAGYFSTTLLSYDIDVELTSTKRVGMTRFAFPQRDGDANILFDVTGGLTATHKAYIELLDDSTLVGYKSGGDFWGIPTYETTYFFARFSKPSLTARVWSGTQFYRADEMPAVEGDDIGACLRFNTEEGEEICVKVGISYVSIDNARLNLETELDNREFDRVAADAYAEWNETISRVEVRDDNEDNKTIFYSALYHTLIHPNVFNDVNGEYPDVSNGGVKQANGFTRHTLFSLWDTYRTVHPFLTLVYPEQQNNMVRSMLEHYREAGWLPLWEISGTDTHVMIGDPAAVVIADSYNKGLRGFDEELAFEAVVKSAFVDVNRNPGRPEDAKYMTHGYIPYSEEHIFFSDAGVSVMQEYCLADAALAEMARGMCRTQEAELLELRSRTYVNSFDASTGFFRPRLASGGWFEPFDPEQHEHELTSGRLLAGGPGFTEGSAWNYRFFVPHDQPGLIRLMGEERWLSALQEYFSEGRFAWNQHNLAFPFLFNYLPGEQWRSVETTRSMMREFFSAGAGGLPGSDDAGGLSAWYLFAALGFYPDYPGGTFYQVSSPLFEEVTLHLDRRYYPGSSFVIRAERESPDSKFVRAAKLNGELFSAVQLDHATIVAGGLLEFDLQDEPGSSLHPNSHVEIKLSESLPLHDPDEVVILSQGLKPHENLQLEVSDDTSMCRPLYTITYTDSLPSAVLTSLPENKLLFVRGRSVSNGASGLWSNSVSFRTGPGWTDNPQGKNEQGLQIVSFGPNPASERIGIVLYSGNSHELRLRVFNMHGGLVARTTFRCEAHSAQYQMIDVRSLATGVYVLEVEGGGEREAALFNVIN